MNGKEWCGTLGLGVSSGMLSWLFHQQVLGGLLHVQDEINYVWQSRIFEQGRLTAPPTPFPDLFVYLFQLTGPEGTYSIFPPGWSLLLGLLAPLHLRPVLPMLLGALCVPTLYALTQQLLRVPFADSVLTPLEERLLPWVAAGLLAFSPAHVVMSGTFMAHTFCLLLCLLSLLAGVKLWLGQRWPAAVGVGTGLGWLVCTRPVDALAVGGPLLLLLAWRLGHARAWRAAGALAVSLGLPLLALGLYHLTLTGSPTVFPQDRYFAEEPPWVVAQQKVLGSDPESDVRYALTCNALGFGPDRGCSKTYGSFGHSPAKAWRNIKANAIPFDRQLLGIVGASLLVPLGGWRLRRRALLFVPMLVLVPSLYALYWYHGVAYGARFWQPLLIPALLGMASVLGWIVQGLSSRLVGLRPGVLLVALAGLLLSLSSGTVRALLLEYNNRYWCVDDRLLTTVAPFLKPPSLVLIQHRGTELLSSPLSSLPEQPALCNNLLRAGSGIQQNPPTLDGPVLYGLIPVSRERFEAVRAQLQRQVLLYELDTLAGQEKVLEATAEGLVPLLSRSVPITGLSREELRALRGPEPTDD